MKQGTLFFRILTVGVLVVILAYLGSSGLKSMQDTMLTTIAIEYEAGDTYLASGYIVRDEQVLPLSPFRRSQKAPRPVWARS